MEGIETAMMAAAFAEEGETGMARELLKDERRIVLAVRRDNLDNKTFRYALNTCKRIGADLDILYISSSDADDPLLETYIAELKAAGVYYRLTRKKGSFIEEVIKYTNEKRKILFAVTESAGSLKGERKGGNPMLSAAWRNLECPLVVVGESI